MFPNVRWNEKNDVIMFVCQFDKIEDIIVSNVIWNEKTDVVIVCLPILDEMRRMTS